MPPAFRGGLVHELPDHVEARQPRLPPGGLKRAIGSAPAKPIALLVAVEQVERHPLEHQPPLPRRIVQGRLVMHLAPCTLTHASRLLRGRNPVLRAAAVTAASDARARRLL